MIKYYCYNGSITPADQTALPINDLAILRGFGVFDYFIVRESYPLFIDDYLVRFENSVKELGMELPVSLTILKSKVFELIEANGIPNAGMRLLCTGGISPDGITPSHPNWLILQHPFPSYAPELFVTGTKLIAQEYRRLLPAAKSTNYLMAVMLNKKMVAAGASDILYHDQGLIYEPSRSNFFIVTKENVLVTAKNNVLKGVIRMKVLEIASKIYKVEERDLQWEELKTAKEAFMSSSIKGVLPVVQIDDLHIGNGQVGAITKDLMQRLENLKQVYLQEQK